MLEHQSRRLLTLSPEHQHSSCGMFHKPLGFPQYSGEEEEEEEGSEAQQQHAEAECEWGRRDGSPALTCSFSMVRRSSLSVDCRSWLSRCSTLSCIWNTHRPPQHHCLQTEASPSSTQQHSLYHTHLTVQVSPLRMPTKGTTLNCALSLPQLLL